MHFRLVFLSTVTFFAYATAGEQKEGRETGL